MQAFLEDFVDGRKAQARIHLGGQALGRATIEAWQAREDLVDLFAASTQRTRHIRA